MTQRIDYMNAAPEALKKMYALEAYLKHCGLEKSLQELVKFRVSQINGCAYCLDMHSKDARAAGETEQRLFCLLAWRESPFYSERERAALDWAEHLTLISEKHVPDDLFERTRKHFSDEELVNLTLAVTMINSWNRFAISFKSEIGSYQPASVSA
jgi:AhpD family alkylhydroperoxidase